METRRSPDHPMSLATATRTDGSPCLSVIVVSWNTRDVLRRCLASVSRHLAGADYECLVVDNASVDGSPEMVAHEFPAVQLLRQPTNAGFGAGCNAGMRTARGRYFLLLNSDTELLDDGALRLVARLEASAGVGVVGPRIVLGDGRLQASARRFPSLGRLLLASLWLHRLLPPARAARLLLGPYWDHAEEREADWVVGAAMFVRREVFEETGGFDERIFLYGEEVEWCRRIRARGWSVLFSPLGSVRHLNHQSTDRLLGGTNRVDRCLLAEDRLLAAGSGRAAGVAAVGVRIAGAGLRLLGFGLRGWLGRDDDYGRAVRREARLVLRHYQRRLLGRIASGHSHEAVP